MERIKKREGMNLKRIKKRGGWGINLERKRRRGKNEKIWGNKL